MPDKPLSQRMGGFVIATVLVLGAFFIGGLVGNWNPFRGSEYTQVGPSVIESVQALADLTTVVMV